MIWQIQVVDIELNDEMHFVLHNKAHSTDGHIVTNPSTLWEPSGSPFLQVFLLFIVPDK